MQPTPSEVHVNRPLTNISIAMLQTADKFIASRVFPNIPVQKQADKYFVYDRGQWNRDDMKERAPATETEGTGYSVDSSPVYYARVYGFHHDIPDQVRANADDPLTFDTEATEFCTLKALIKREKTFVANYFKGGIWTGGDFDGVAAGPGANQVLQWNLASSTPITDVRDARRTVAESTGYEPNTFVIGRAVYDKLLDHPTIVDRVKYGTQTGGPGTASLANLDVLRQLFEIPNILVMNSIENTAKEGQTNAHAFIGGKKALLCYSEPSPGLMKPSAGYTFSWTGYLAAGPEGNRIYRFRMENLRSDRVEIEIAFDQKQIASDLGYFFDTIVG